MSVDNRPWPLADHLPTPPLHGQDEGKTQANSPPVLPLRKRNRVTSLQLCYSRAWLGQGHLQDNHLTPEEKVRRVIDTVVDNGYEQVDLSHCDLVEIPGGIAELQHITVLQKDTVKTASLQLYLFANQLKSLSPALFQLKNLTVLSLRCNKLTIIPPDIALLENLVELSLGNNHLTYLPSELQQLAKLTLLSVCPNPFIPTPNDRSTPTSLPPCKYTRPGHVCHTLPSLFEIASRHYLSSSTGRQKIVLPFAIQQCLDSVSPINKCHTCKRPFVDSTTQEMVWMDLINVKMVPLLYRFCSMPCARQLVL
ncbi:hypothetical protein BC941DRAFT_438079 [Chlamydoabsidia padenii]|nr:hypothetical protein BC941DRAFT_438079 [Chlamydoabsidia padenii]